MALSAKAERLARWERETGNPRHGRVLDLSDLDKRRSHHDELDDATREGSTSARHAHVPDLSQPCQRSSRRESSGEVTRERPSSAQDRWSRLSFSSSEDAANGPSEPSRVRRRSDASMSRLHAWEHMKRRSSRDGHYFDGESMNAIPMRWVHRATTTTDEFGWGSAHAHAQMRIRKEHQEDEELARIEIHVPNYFTAALERVPSKAGGWRQNFTVTRDNMRTPEVVHRHAMHIAGADGMSGLDELSSCGQPEIVRNLVDKAAAHAGMPSCDAFLQALLAIDSEDQMMTCAVSSLRELGC